MDITVINDGSEGKIQGRAKRKSRQVLRTKGSMYQRLMDAVPFPAIYGDLVQETVVVLKAMADHRSPLDVRHHEGLKQSKTQSHTRRQTVYASMRHLKRCYPGLALLKMRREHVDALLELWGKSENAAGAIVNKLAHLRAFLAYARLDVDALVPSNREALQHLSIDPRVFVDGRDKSLEGNGVDFWVIFDRAFSEDPRVAVIFLVAWRFGLRLEEAMKWRPHKDFIDLGATGYIGVVRGTKNGKKRGFVMRLDADDRAAVGLAKVYAAKGTGGLIPDEVAREQRFRDHVEDVARRIGFSRKSLGVTPHGLRHSFAKRTHEEQLKIVNGGVMPTVLRPEEDFVARRATSETLGHHRVGITSCYLGAPAKPFASS